jgi:geranylgeranyl diphosphate synthase type II
MSTSLFKRYATKVDNTLARQDFDHDPPELYAPIDYVLKLGGKRLRPALCLAACELYGGELEEAMLPAVGLELFHNFSLVHDDIMDRADKRRGKPTVHTKWDQNRALLTGDALLVQAYQYLSKVKTPLLPRVMKVFNQTAMELCEGQQLDINFETGQPATEQEYLEMITLKTAVLLGCSLRVGAIIGGATPSQAEHLYQFGLAAGQAFQVQDDWLDAFGDQQKVGKQAGGDILQDKQTLLVIYARQLDPDGWKALREQALQGEEKVAAYTRFFHESGARKQAEQRREALLEEAHKELKAAGGSDDDIREHLAQFATWLARRDR